MANPLYNYIRNQYILGKFSEDDLTRLASLGHITDDERLEILKIKLNPIKY